MELVLSYRQCARLVAAIARGPKPLNAFEILLQLVPPSAHVRPGLAVDDLANIAGCVPLAARAIVESLGRLPR
eukprot:7391869-Prymnesium_polylepis.3